MTTVFKGLANETAQTGTSQCHDFKNVRLIVCFCVRDGEREDCVPLMVL